jgi:hypothetical protein
MSDFRAELRAAEAGDHQAEVSVGWRLMTGDGIDIDKTAAVGWLRRAAQAGSAEGQLYLGVAYQNGDGVACDIVEAIRWYREAAAQGHPGAQFNLGNLSRDGEGLRLDRDNARVFFEAAARQGHAGAAYNLAWLLDEREPVDLRSLAIEWYVKAAELGVIEAARRLGSMFETGEVSVPDPDMAMVWYEKAAQHGDAIAQFRLSLLLEAKEGAGHEDFHYAYQLLEQSARQRYPPALTMLAYWLETGLHDTTNDCDKAVSLYEQAAALGDADAMMALGEKYEEGEGVNRDVRRARDWFKRALDAGCEEAVAALKRV